MKAKEFDKKLDEGADVMDVLSVSRAKRSMQKQRRSCLDD